MKGAHTSNSNFLVWSVFFVDFAGRSQHLLFWPISVLKLRICHNHIILDLSFDLLLERYCFRVYPAFATWLMDQRLACNWTRKLEDKHSTCLLSIGGYRKWGLITNFWYTVPLASPKRLETQAMPIITLGSWSLHGSCRAGPVLQDKQRRTLRGKTDLDPIEREFMYNWNVFVKDCPLHADLQVRLGCRVCYHMSLWCTAWGNMVHNKLLCKCTSVSQFQQQRLSLEHLP